MKISTLLEERKLLAVVYGGRFQPFHKGHYAVYRELCKAFGEGAVWIATSNKTNFDPAEGDISPFTFDERLEIMVQLFGISPEKVIKCKNPAFAPKEILDLYKGPTVCVMVAGDKDVERYSKSKLYKLYPTREQKPLPFDQVMPKLLTVGSEPPQFYYTISHARNGSQSGTSIREAFQAAGDDEGKQVAAFKKFYGKVNDDILDLMVSKIRMIKPPPPPKKSKDDKPVKATNKDKLPTPKLDKELSLTSDEPEQDKLPPPKLGKTLSLTEVSQMPNLSAGKLVPRSQLLKLQQELIDMLPDRFDVELDEHGVTVQEPKSPSRSGKKLWVIPNTFDGSLYYGGLDMKGITYREPRHNALLNLVQFITLDITT